MIEQPQPTQLSPVRNEVSYKEISFSPLLTALCLLVCGSALALLLWGASSSERFSESETMGRDLERLASRILSFESRLSDLSALEKRIFYVWGEDGDSQEQLLQWYAEFPHESRNPQDELYAEILEAEKELRAGHVKAKGSLGLERHLLPMFQQLLDAGYLGGPRSRLEYEKLQAQLAEEIPGNWFYYQLAGRLAGQSGNHVLQENLHHQFALQTAPLLWKWRILVFVEMTLVGIGLMCFVFVVRKWLKKREDQVSEKKCHTKILWTFQEGVAVLARGGALSIILMSFFAVVPYGVNMLEDYGSLLLYLPTVLLAVLVCHSKDQSFLEVIGCKKIPQIIKPTFPLLLSAIALGLIGDWMIMLWAERLKMSVHWSEWFIPQFVWGNQAELLGITMDVVILAPIFEEMIFRGLVFSTLRAKFNFPLSMLGSAFIFALAHGYGLIAFLTVFWSGLLWAWLFERTGSVVPGMCAHAINNGMVAYFLVALFR